MVLVCKVKGTPCNFEACLCASLYYSAFKISFKPFGFHNKRFQTPFKDQLDRSKATCSFNHWLKIKIFVIPDETELIHQLNFTWYMLLITCFKMLSQKPSTLRRCLQGFKTCPMALPTHSPLMLQAPHFCPRCVTARMPCIEGVHKPTKNKSMFFNSLFVDILVAPLYIYLSWK